ncbi:MAG: hypothetical protein ABFS46_20045 [Myxococcota bacterium]
MSPFGWVSEDAQPRLLLVLTLLLAALSVWLSAVGQALVTPEAPLGIVSYEFAGSMDLSSAILASWSAHARAMAMLSLGLDFLYLLVYPAWFSLAAVRVGRGLGAGWRGPGAAVAWGVLLCAPLDAVENHGLIQQLVHGPTDGYARLAWAAAAPKFALVGIAALYLMAAGTTRLLARMRRG